MRLLACAGQLRQGKDVTADYLAKRLGWGRGSFASNVKRIFCETFGVDLDFIEKWKTVSEPPPGFKIPVRQALQFIGDGFRSIKDEIWIEMLLRIDHKSLIISDVRYKNELLAVRERGGKNILIYRPGFINNDPNDSESQIREFVEYFLKEGIEGRVNCSTGDFGLVDFFLVNDGSLDQLYSKIDDLILPFLEFSN
jgi:hypothetical protein